MQKLGCRVCLSEECWSEKSWMGGREVVVADRRVRKEHGGVKKGSDRCCSCIAMQPRSTVPDSKSR